MPIDLLPNPRYEAYAAAHGMTWREMLDHWKAIRDGDKPNDRTVEIYSIWLIGQVIAWMECVQLSRKLAGFTEAETLSYALCCACHRGSFDAWLSQRWSPVEESHEEREAESDAHHRRLPVARRCAGTYRKKG